MQLKRRKILYSFIIIFSNFISYSQSNISHVKKEVDDYFENQDKEKSLAAAFLIKYIPIHYSVDNIWLDNHNKPVDFKSTNFTDLEEAYKEFTLLKKSRQLKPKKSIIQDTDKVESSFLIKNIESAYKSWKNNPWSKNYDFKTFCEYILPYRSLTEPVEDWRTNYQATFEKLTINMSDPSDPVELCSKIIENIKHFDFVSKRYDPKPLLGPNELLFWREGNCPDLANVAIFASRSLGVAVTFDFTPHFAASSNRHYWNTVIDNQGLHIPFNGNQNLPYAYNAVSKRLGKVFRITYSEQSNNLNSVVPENEIPEELNCKYMIDVTKEYVEVSDINYTFNNTYNAKVGYINVFNMGNWKPVYWSKIKEKKCNFNNMGNDIVYLPGTFISGKMNLENFPILIDKTGSQIVLKPNFKNIFSADLTRSNETKTKYSDNNPFQIIKGEAYNLLVWNGSWQLVEQQMAYNDDHIKFTKIPKNGLFLITTLKPDFFERICTINSDNGTISWY